MTETGYPTGLRRAAIVVTVMLSALMAVIDTSIVNVSLPTIGASLGASVSDMSWIAIGYMLANIIVMPLNGFLSAFFGQKRFFLIAVSGFTLTSCLCGLAWNIESLILFRIFQGLFGGVLMPISQTVLFQTYPKSEHGKAMGMFGLGVIAGPALGPTLGGYLTDLWGWPMIFNINLPVGVLAVFMGLRSLPDSTPMPPKKFDTFGLVSMAVGLGAVQYVLEKGAEDGWDSAFIIGLALLGTLSLCAFIWRELTVEHPVVDLRVLKDVSFTAGSIIGVITGFGLFGMNIVLPLFCASVLRYNAVQTGLALLPGALATALAMPLVGRFADRFDPRILMSSGIGMFLYFLWDLMSISPDTGYWNIFWPQVIRGVGLALLFVPLSAATMRNISRERQAAASGLNNLLRQLGGSVGIALLTNQLTSSQKSHYGSLIAHINPFSPETQQRLQLLQAGMMAKGAAAATAQTQALALMAGSVRLQANLLAYMDLFRFSGIVFLFSLLPVLVLRRGKAAGGGGAPAAADLH